MKDDGYEEKLKRADRQFNRISDIFRDESLENIVLTKAYEIIKAHFKDQERVSGELSILHHLNVAQIMTDQGFELPIIVASLLHDLVEDTNYGFSENSETLPEDESMEDYNERPYKKLQEEIDEACNSVSTSTKCYGEEVSNLVKALTKISKTKEMGVSTDKYEQDLKYYKNLLAADECFRSAFYIKFADRIDNFSDMQYLTPESITRNIRSTKRFLMPLAKNMGASWFYSKLGDRVFAFEKPKEYIPIKSHYDYYSENKHEKIINNTEKKIRLIFKDDQSTINKALCELRANIKSILIEEPNPFNISEFSSQYINEQTQTSLRPFNPMRLVYILFISEPDISHFMLAYNEALRDDLALVMFDSSTNVESSLNGSNAKFFTTQDLAGNLYQIYLMTSKSYILHKYGSVKKMEIPVINPDPIQEKELITVKTKDDEVKSIEKGATILDFAFELHENIGLFAKGAKHNGRKVEQLESILQNDDSVEIISGYERGSDMTGKIPHAELDWFLKLNTYNAKKKLVKYFKDKYENSTK